jgi:hypothetical protein
VERGFAPCGVRSKPTGFAAEGIDTCLPFSSTWISPFPSVSCMSLALKGPRLSPVVSVSPLTSAFPDWSTRHTHTVPVGVSDTVASDGVVVVVVEL